MVRGCRNHQAMSLRSTIFKQPLRQGSAPQLLHCSPLPIRQHVLRRGNWSTFSQHSLVRQCSSRSRPASKAVNSLASTLSAPHRAMSESPHSRVLASTDQLDSSSTAAAPIVTTVGSCAHSLQPHSKALRSLLPELYSKLLTLISTAVTFVRTISRCR